jgi:hypothetical protein
MGNILNTVSRRKVKIFFRIHFQFHHLNFDFFFFFPRQP